MKILLVTHHFPGHLEESRTKVTYAIYNLVKPWAEKGNDIFVFRLVPFYRYFQKGRKQQRFTEFQQNLTVFSFPFFKIPRIHWNFLKSAGKAMIHKIPFKPDIIVTHGYLGLQACEYIKKEKPEIPIVFGVHYTDSQLTRMKYRDIPDAYAFRSSSVKHLYSEKFSVNKPCFIASSGIDESVIVEKIKSLNTPKVLNFITVSNLIPRKNIDKVLAALSSLPQECTWSYTIVGDGSEGPRLKNLVNELKLQDRVEFKGAQPHEYCLELMDHADIFIMPSAPETFGLVFLEAMARGLVIIGAKGWGIDGIVHHKQNGFLVDLDNNQSLKNILKEIFSLNLDTVKQHSLETVNSNTTEKASDRYLDYLCEIKRSITPL